jgi:tetratricopeptide (TPR) repeat protein
MFAPKWFDKPQDALQVLREASKPGRGRLTNSLVGENADVLQTAPEGTALLKQAFAGAFIAPSGWFGPEWQDRGTKINSLWETALTAPTAAKWGAFADWTSNLESEIRVGRPYGELSTDEQHLCALLNGYSTFGRRRQLGLAPKDGRALAQLAQSLYIAGDRDQADEVVKQAIALSPKDPLAVGVAVHYAALEWGADPERVVQVSRLAAADPEVFRQCASEIATNLASIVENGAALAPQDAKLLERANAEVEHPDFANAKASTFANLVQHFWRRNQPVKAVEIARQWTAKFPESAEAHYRLASVLAANKQVDEATEEFRAALKINPDHAGAALYLGNNLFRQKKMAEAETLYRQAIASLPIWQQAHLELARVLKGEKKLDEAAAELDLVFDAGGDNRTVTAAREVQMSLGSDIQLASQKN